MLKVEQIEEIRKMHFIKKYSIRKISKETGIHRTTISKYLSGEIVDIPKYRKPAKRNHPVLGPFIPAIEKILEEDKTRHRKQRHTGAKIFEILREEGYKGGYTTLTDYLRKIRPKTKEAFLPLEFELGAYAEVDWTKAHIFIIKLRGSGGYYAIAYPFEKQEAFFDAHIKSFEFFNGVPYKIAYDNLKTAVKKILQGNNREEQEQFIGLRSHYLYESTFCRPARGNEKGGVENAAREIVRKFFVPYPQVDSFEELNQYLHNECLKLLEKNNRWSAEISALRPLPQSRFNAARYKEAKVNTYAMVQFETNRYSVPANHVGERVTLKITANEIEIIAENKLIAKHCRIIERNKDSLVLDHYLDLLLRKSRAVGNTKVYQPQKLPQIYEEYRKQLVARVTRGNREFVKILMLHRDYSSKQVTEAVEIAMSYNIYGYDGVMNILGQLNFSTPKVVPLSTERIQDIPQVNVNSPNLEKFRMLMGGNS